MARVAAFTDDLLFGSNIVGTLSAAGHEVELVSVPSGVDADVLVVDLTADARERIGLVEAARRPGLRTLAYYAHVESEVRTLAERAGIDLVVPRSRMAREGPALVARLTADQ